MLFLHTAGVSKIGQVYRYTITYTPSSDPISPPPPALHLRVKNTASLPLRAAYLQGPYTLYVSVRRQEFEPWASDTPGTQGQKEELAQEEDRDPAFGGEEGVPVFDPQLRAGSSFYATLPVPSSLVEDALTASIHTRRGFEHGSQHSLDNLRSSTGTFAKPRRKSVTWIVEVISQTMFSATATVGFEIMLGGDEKSLNHSVLSTLRPGSSGSEISERSDSGIFSRALKVKVQDTHDLWNIPPFPSWDKEAEDLRMQNGEYLDPEYQDEPVGKQQGRKKGQGKTKRVHLVILTHGLHSNTGADMLFMKEAIDEEVRKGDIAWREKRREERAAGKQVQTDSEVEEDEEGREQVIVRGFHENVCRTERGIKYLGRRLARYVLHLVHPNTSSPPPAPQKLRKERRTHLTPFALLASMADNDSDDDVPPYKVTSISFIGHSLGGLVQTYAIAYIHAHSPSFFTDITPISFVALATPFLGLSNENPMYVKFALDFGLVGRTGQDLGLTWRAPSAFSAFTTRPVGVAAVAARPTDTSKPLLRILPTGPAHEVLKRFRNRTVYANVVNDGIVPLRTSCLLFLDWKGLGKVEKARSESNAVQGLVGWGWGQLTKGGSTSPRGSLYASSITKNKAGGDSAATSPVSSNNGKSAGESPLTIAGDGDMGDNPIPEAPLTGEPTRESKASSEVSYAKGSGTLSPLSSLLTLFRPNASSKSKGSESKSSKIYRRSQTIPFKDDNSSSKKPTKIKTAPGFTQPLDVDPVPAAPPRTTLLEAANHILNPPLPSTEFLIDPSSRPHTIFHDRVYSPNDVPPPRSNPNASDKGKDMKVEEKIARAYHGDLAWRKVLVSLEPDAHNNMIVRRMFANAYGWPVVHHVVETHFGESWCARTADKDEGKQDRSFTLEEATNINNDGQRIPISQSCKDINLELETQLDLEREISSIRDRTRSPATSSGAWSDKAFAVTDEEDSDSDVEAQKEEEISRFLGLQPRLQRPVLGDEMEYKSGSTTAGVSRVQVVVSPCGSGSGDLGDDPSAIWGDGNTGSGLGPGVVTRIGLGRWSSTAGISLGTRATGASLETTRGSGGGSDAVRLLERNISIAGPSRNTPRNESRASSRSGGTERSIRAGGNSRAGSYTDEQIQGDLGERDRTLSLASGVRAVN